ncbi:MAG: peptidylprolyl isomerase [Acidimicrobiia bacterium]
MSDDDLTGADDSPQDDPAAPAVPAEAEAAGQPWYRKWGLAAAVAAGVFVVGGGLVVVLGVGGGSCPGGDNVLEVEGEPVTLEQLSRRAELVDALYGLEAPEGERGESYRRELAKSMATALIVEEEADRRQVVVADRAVRDALDRYIADFFPDGGRDAFVEAMGNRGVSEAEVLGEFRQIQTTFRLLDEATGEIEVTDAEVAAEYEERKDELVLPEQRKLRHLVVATAADADAALARIRGGEDFAAVASAVTLDATTKAQGGDLGTRSAGDLEPAFSQAAFAAAVGQPFGPVRTRFGYHVGLVTEVLPPRPLTEEEATAALREQMLAERKLAAQRAYTAKILADADVCYAERFRPADPTAPPPAPAPGITTTTTGPGPGR